MATTHWINDNPYFINNIPEGQSPILQEKWYTSLRNGTQLITPDTGYQGMTLVHLDNMIRIPSPDLSPLETTITTNTTIHCTPPTNKDGFSDATIITNVLPNLTSITTTLTTNTTLTINTPTGFDGISLVNIETDIPIPNTELTTITDTITTNTTLTYTPPDGYIGLASLNLTVDVPTPTINLQTITDSITTNTSIRYSPSFGYNGIAYLDLTINVPQNPTPSSGITINGYITHEPHSAVWIYHTLTFSNYYTLGSSIMPDSYKLFISDLYDYDQPSSLVVIHHTKTPSSGIVNNSGWYIDCDYDNVWLVYYPDSRGSDTIIPNTDPFITHMTGIPLYKNNATPDTQICLEKQNWQTLYLRAEPNHFPSN